MTRMQWWEWIGFAAWALIVAFAAWCLVAGEI